MNENDIQIRNGLDSLIHSHWRIVLDDALKKLQKNSDKEVTTNGKATDSVTVPLTNNNAVKTVDSQEDLNKLGNEELAARKATMDQVFEKNRKKNR